MSTIEELSHSDGEHDERVAIRKELSSLSFEDLQKLKERVGAKVYKEVIFGKNEKISEEKKTFKRENKNRPREMSSKKPVSMLPDVVPKKKKEIRDPRFDPLCGSFDKKEFTENYRFLSNMRINDIKAIKVELKQTTDPQKEIKLRRLLQRLKDQHRADSKKKLEQDKAKTLRLNSSDETQTQPYFKNKSQLRVESLVEQYENLKKGGAGRIQRHLKRRQQKLKKRSYRAPVELGNK